MANLQINLLPEVAEVFSVDKEINSNIVGIAGIAGEIDLTTISLARVKELYHLGLSRVLKIKKAEVKAIDTK